MGRSRAPPKPTASAFPRLPAVLGIFGCGSVMCFSKALEGAKSNGRATVLSMASDAHAWVAGWVAGVSEVSVRQLQQQIRAKQRIGV